MGIAIRQSIFTSVISYTGVVIGYINLLYLYPKFLAPEQIGLLRSIQDGAMLCTPFAVFGLGQAVLKYYPYFSESKKKAGSFMNLIFVMAIVTYGIFILVFLLFKSYIISFFDKNAESLISYFPLVLWLTFFLLTMTLLEQYYRSLIQVAFTAFVREILIRLMQGALVSLYFLKIISFDQFLIASVLIYVIALVILASYLLKQGQLNFNFNFHSQSLTVVPLKHIFTFSALSFIGTSSMILIGKIDSVMVSGMIGFASNAVYTTAFYIATVIDIPKRAITQTASPLLARAFEKNDLTEVASVYRKTANNQFVIGTLLLIGIWANISNIFKLIPNGAIYESGILVVMIVGCGKLLDMMFGPSTELISLSRHYWFNLVVITLLATSLIVGNFLLIPRFGIDGAAVSSVLALGAYNIIKFLYIFLKLRIHPFAISTLKILCVGVVVVAVNWLLPEVSNVFIDITYRSTIITFVFAALILGVQCSEEINRLADEFLRKLGLRR